MKYTGIGSKTKHMGTSWMKVDEEHSVLTSNRKGIIFDDIDVPEININYQAYNRLNNVTFNIPEDAEYSDYTPNRLLLDKLPEILEGRRYKSTLRRGKNQEYFTKNTLKKQQHKRGQSKETLFNESYRLKNLYYYLHSENIADEPKKTIRSYTKYNKLQLAFKTSEGIEKYKQHLKKNNWRLPVCLEEVKYPYNQ